jgi:hypothetical protein
MIRCRILAGWHFSRGTGRRAAAADPHPLRDRAGQVAGSDALQARVREPWFLKDDAREVRPYRATQGRGDRRRAGVGLDSS